jgi:hypothetical protein
MILNNGIRHVLVVFLLLTGLWLRAQIHINEVVSDNFLSLQDEDGDYPSWIELYNSGNQPVNLSQWRLKDKSIVAGSEYRFHQYTLMPRAYVVVFLSGKHRMNVGRFHAGFAQSGTISVGLINPNGVETEHIHLARADADVSYARVVDGQGEWKYMQPSTPGKSNTGMQDVVPFTCRVFMSPFGGFYPGKEIRIDMISSLQGVDIYYTLNGTEPDTGDYLFEHPFNITTDDEVEGVLSGIRSGGITTDDGRPYEWRAPDKPFKKGVVLRARAFSEGKPVSKTVSATYFFSEGNRSYTFPVFSFVVEPEDFFDDHLGIYVPGVNLDNGNQPNRYISGGNYLMSGREWERKAHVSVFNVHGEIDWQMDVGVRIHGGSSRNKPQKSLRLYARHHYESPQFNYAFLPQRNFKAYKHMLLRNSGQDNNRTMFADAFTASLFDPFDFEFQRHSPAIQFINGEYWGILNIRDRISDRFIAYMHPHVDLEKVRISAFWEEEPDGTAYLHNEVRTYMMQHDMNTDHAKNFVEDRFDVNNYIDYYIAKIMIGAYDWPGNNVEVWWEEKPGSKLRWIMFDNDDAFYYSPSYNSLWHAIKKDGEEWPNPEWSTFVFRKFLENDEFKKRFIKRSEEMISSQMNTKKLLRHIDSFENMYEPEIQDHIDRWQLIEGKHAWKSHIHRMRNFARLRPCYLKGHYMEVFRLEDGEFLSHLDCGGFQQEEGIWVEIHGNPGKNHLDLMVTINSDERVTIQVFSAVGRLIHQEETQVQAGTHIFPVSLHQKSAPGVHTVMVISGKSAQSVKWMRLPNEG